ncbi:MAG: hypothetical protein IJ203_06730 [Atopobiaceae bacterium]|nr:hypothetical protein [Atopobiaceae bacterium]
MPEDQGREYGRIERTDAFIPADDTDLLFVGRSASRVSAVAATTVLLVVFCAILSLI